MGRFANPNSDSIYGYSDDVGEWVGPQILIGGNVGGAAKGATFAGSLSEKTLASAAVSISGRAGSAVGRAAVKGGDELVDVFRVVGPEEAADIAKTGAYRVQPRGAGKYFFPPRGKRRIWARCI